MVQAAPLLPPQTITWMDNLFSSILQHWEAKETSKLSEAFTSLSSTLAVARVCGGVRRARVCRALS